MDFEIHRSQKVHRASAILYSQQNSFEERRFSDLLPSFAISELEIDPNKVFKGEENKPSFQLPAQIPSIERRLTDPGYGFYEPMHVNSRHLSLVSDYDLFPAVNPLELAKANQMVVCFSVELADCIVDAYSTHSLHANASDGVLVRDGMYIRFGRIVKQIKPEECLEGSLQIISMDNDGAFGDYIIGQSMICSKLIPVFLEQCGSKAKMLSCETVSYQARALIRVFVTDVQDPAIPAVIQKVMDVFNSPVEFYSD